MEPIIETIVDYACHMRNTRLPIRTEQACRQRLVDLVGCAMAAVHAPPVRMARQLALRPGLHGPAQLMGSRAKTSPELATLTNALMVRYLDGADTFPGGGGHPSDTWSAIMAIAQAQGRTLGDALQAAASAYEVFHAVFKGAHLRERGIDNAFYVSLANVVAVGQLLELSRQQLAHALSMVITANVSLAVARTGALSMWKSGASGHAAMNAVLVCLMAAQGMEGPAEPLSGHRGLFDLVGPFKIEDLGDGSQHPMCIERSDMKAYLCDYHSQTPILAASQLHQRLAGRTIAKVTIETYPFALSEAAGEPAKWHPLNRETADHSMPWIVAGVLIDGQFSENIYSPQKLSDPRMHALTDRIAVSVAEDLKDRFPAEVPCRMTISTACGATLSATEHLPLGHHLKAMTPEQTQDKFSALLEPILSSTQQKQALDWMWQAPTVRTFDGLFDALAVMDRG